MHLGDWFYNNVSPTQCQLSLEIVLAAVSYCCHVAATADDHVETGWQLPCTITAG